MAPPRLTMPVMRLENPLVGGAALAAWGFSLPRRLAPPGKREKKQNLALTYFSCREGGRCREWGYPPPLGSESLRWARASRSPKHQPATRCISVRMGRTGGRLTVWRVLRRIGNKPTDQHEVIRVRTLPDLDIEAMVTCCFPSVQFSDGFAEYRPTTTLILVPAGSGQIQHLDQIHKSNRMFLTFE